MRWATRESKYNQWERIFAWVPHYVEDTDEYVWLERIYRSIECGRFDAWYRYRSERP